MECVSIDVAVVFSAAGRPSGAAGRSLVSSLISALEEIKNVINCTRSWLGSFDWIATRPSVEHCAVVLSLWSQGIGRARVAVLCANTVHYTLAT